MKDELSSKQMDSIYLALSNPVRRDIIKLLGQRKMMFTEILKTLSLEPGSFSHHIKQMDGLVEQDENKIYKLSELGYKSLVMMKEDENMIISNKRRMKLFANRYKKCLFMAGVAFVVLLSLSYMFLLYDWNSSRETSMNFYSTDPRFLEGIRSLQTATKNNSIVLSWWDYGIAIENFGNRQAIIKNPSKEIAYSTADWQHSYFRRIEWQLFGVYDDNEKIKDAASALCGNEQDAASAMKKYGASYILVVYPDDLEKLYWI